MSAAFVQRILDFYGDPLLAPVGVLHVASAALDASGQLALLRIGPDTPKSRSDAFVLELARARADAVITTGRILREEPALRLLLGAEAERWRRDALGKLAPPALVVLSGGSSLPADHQVFDGPGEALVFTTRDGAIHLAESDFRRRPEIEAHPAPDLRATIAAARRRFGPSVSIEAGASTSAELYRPPVAVDELLLSIFDGRVDESGLAARLPPLERLQALLPRHGAPRVVRELSGPWRFFRLRRESD